MSTSLRKHPFSTLFVAVDVSRETSSATKSEEKRMFSQATCQPNNVSQTLWQTLETTKNIFEKRFIGLNVFINHNCKPF